MEKKTLKQLCLERGVTVAELADALNVSKGTCQNWYNYTKVPSVKNREQLAAFFGLRFDEISYERPDEAQLPKLTPLTYQGVNEPLSLTNEQHQNILMWIAAGHTRQEISGALGISRTTLHALLTSFAHRKAKSQRVTAPKPKAPKPKTLASQAVQRA